jgi:dTDP-glucose 4,6-dehydratase
MFTSIKLKTNKIAVVTGCAGFIGSALTQKLLLEGWYVYGIDKLTYVANVEFIQNLKTVYPKHFKLVIQDICDVAWLPECDVIFNLAAESDVDNSTFDDTSFIQSNIKGVQNLLNIVNKKLLLRSDKPLFFHVSTDEVYGDSSLAPNSENSKLNPSNPYAATKAAADLLIQSWHRTHKLQYVIVRPSNNYGPRQYPEKLIPLSVKRLTRNKQIKLHNGGTPLRTWTHVDDTVEAINTIYKQGKFNTIYNISSEYEQSNIDTVSQIIQFYFNSQIKNVEEYLDFSYNRPGQDVHYRISCEPLKQLGWKPSKNFTAELQKLVNTYKQGFTW